MKKFLFLITSLLVINSFSTYAQEISVQSVNSGGKKMLQNNGSLSFTVGELVVLTQKDNQGNSIGGGFTSSSVLTTASIIEPNVEVLNVKVYPNPTTDLLTVAIQDTKLDNVIVEVIDTKGTIMSYQKYIGMTNSIGINTCEWAKGNYILYLKDSKYQVIGSYKISKQ